MARQCEGCGKDLSAGNSFALEGRVFCKECNAKISGAEQRGESLKGVAGWLVLFCFSLTILAPLAAFFSLASRYSAFSESPYWRSGLADYTGIDTLAVAALTVIGIVVGVMMWKVLPGALPVARVYCVIGLAYGVVGFFLPAIVGLRPELGDVLIGWPVRRVIAFGVWLAYLLRSRRVRATYLS